MATQRPNTTLPGIVETIIESPHPNEPEKAQIAIKGTDDRYREIRIENALKVENASRQAPVKVNIKAKRRAAMAGAENRLLLLAPFDRERIPETVATKSFRRPWPRWSDPLVSESGLCSMSFCTIRTSAPLTPR
jgi:hypothetical protein